MARSVFFRTKSPQGPWKRYSGEFPFNVTGFTPNTVLEYDIGDGVINELTTLEGIKDFYGVGMGQIPMRHDFSKTQVNASNLATFSANAGGAGAAFDLSPINSIPVVNGYLDLTPKNYLTFPIMQPDIIGTRMFLVCNFNTLGVTQYLLGNGNPQSNMYFDSAGARLTTNQRSAISGLFDTTNVNLSSPLSEGLKIYEVEVTPTKISVFVNGVSIGAANHIFSEYKVQHIGAGQFPANGNGISGRMYDILSLVMGGDYDARIPTIRAELAAIYGVTL